MFITPDLYLDCITILFHDNSETNQSIVKELAAVYENATLSGTGSMENDALIELYIWIIKSLMSDDIDRTKESDINTFLLKIKSNPIMEKKRDVYDLLVNILTSRDTMSEEKLSKSIKNIQTKLLLIRMNKVSRMFFGGVNRVSDMANVEDQYKGLQKLMDDMKGAIDETETAVSKTDDEEIETVSFNSKESMRAALKKNADRTVKGVIKTGLQGLNMALGKAGGATLGESIIFNAPSHHCKSLILQLISMWAAIYNDPLPSDGKKPLISLISLENEAFQNFIFIAQSMYYQIVGEEVGDISKDEIQDKLIDWVYEEFSKNGYAFDIVRHLPEQFGYEELVRYINRKEKEGYAVHLCVIDYINNMRKGSRADKHNSNVGNHLLIKELYSRICNYLKTKGITVISAHQLNRDALKLGNLGGKRDVVKHLNSEHLAESVDVQREPDCLVFMYREKNYDGLWFLTFRLDKHRYVNDTPESHKYFAYPFTKHGLLADVNGPAGFTRDIYSFKPKNMELFKDILDDHKNASLMDDDVSAGDIF